MSQLSLFARRAALAAAGVGVVLAGSVALARAAEPVRIGVIAPTSAIDGRSIMQGAEMAADEINAAGGVDGRPIKLYKYDDHASAADGVRAFQRATKQNHAVAVIGNFTSEVALATEPWAARLKEPYIVTGASTTKINERIRNDYAHYKYVFRDTLNSVVVGKIVCGYAKDILVKDLGYKTAAIMSENADWTKPLDKQYQKCLPKAGLKVVDHIRFDPNTNDFSPIFSRIERAKPDVIITGIAHVGVKPTVQWHQNQIPMMFAGWSSQAGASSFWKSTNGAAEDTITGNVASGGAALTPKTIPFIKKYEKRFGESPAYNAYSTYDALYILKNAIERAHSTKPDALVKALEKTDYVGVQGREQFYARHARFAHGLRYGPGYLTGVAIQWQAGKQVVIWPKKAANGQVQVPDFVKHAGNG